MVKTYITALILGMAISLFSCTNGKIRPSEAEATLLLELADSLSKSRVDTAILFYNKVLNNSSLAGTAYNIRALHGIGKIYAFEGRFDSAGAKYEQALAMANSLNDTALMIKSHLLKGNNYGETQLYMQSEEEFTEGLKLAIASKSLNAQNSFKINLGRLKLYSADYAGAITNFTEGARLAMLAGEPYKEGFALEGIAQIMDITGDFSEAIRYNQLAKTIMGKYGYENDMARILINMGLYYKSAGQYDSAIYYLNSADTINRKLNNKRQQIQVIYNKGLIKLDQKKYSEAEKIILATYDACVEEKFIDGQAFSLATLSGLYETIGKSGQALQINEKSIQLITDNHLTFKLTDAYKQRHRILAGMGRYKDAYNSSIQMIIQNDSTISREKQKEIQLLKIRYETRINENKIELLTENVATKAYYNRLQRIGIFILVTMLIIALGLFLYVFRLYRLRNAAYSALSRIYRNQMPEFVSDVNNGIQNNYSGTDRATLTHAKPPGSIDRESLSTENEVSQTEEQLPEIAVATLSDILINQQLYLDPSLTADKLATATGLSRRELARAIKEGFGLSFFQLLNKYRSLHAIALMNDTGNRLLKIEYIGLKSGFSSRATFYSAFTLYTGLPPAIYRDRIFVNKTEGESNPDGTDLKEILEL